jgi:hypothetical protein
MMKKSIILIAAICTTLIASAQRSKSSRSSNDQSYTTALGVKFYPGGISLKHFIRETHALEGIGYFWERGVRITGLYEFYFDIKGVDGLRWYVGPGAHIGFYDDWRYNNKNYKGGSYFGIDGVLGLDYKFANAPINLSIDWQPSVEFGYGPGFTGNWGGLGIRYTW